VQKQRSFSLRCFFVLFILAPKTVNDAENGDKTNCHSRYAGDDAENTF